MIHKHNWDILFLWNNSVKLSLPVETPLFCVHLTLLAIDCINVQIGMVVKKLWKGAPGVKYVLFGSVLWYDLDWM